MNSPPPKIVGLTPAGCETRRARLAAALREQSLDACLLSDRRHIYYFSGYWSAAHHAPQLLLRSDGTYHLALPDVAAGAVDMADVSFYPSHRLGTLVEDQRTAAEALLTRDLQQVDRLGYDVGPPRCRSIPSSADMSLRLLELRRAKLADEAELVGHAIRGCEAAYAWARDRVRPGIREIDIYAEMQATAIKEIGEPIAEMGNDFQSGTPGGPPRTRAIEAGELMPLDVAVAVRGYRCDLCRTFAVGGPPSLVQQEAAERVRQALEYVEQTAERGVSCQALFQEVKAQLEADRPWKFMHHLGHGTGLGAHEPPYLNPEWDDRLEVGDLFTVEPGLYHEELRAGVRIEQNYWLTNEGLQRLSSFSTEL